MNSVNLRRRRPEGWGRCPRRHPRGGAEALRRARRERGLGTQDRARARLQPDRDLPLLPEHPRHHRASAPGGAHAPRRAAAARRPEAARPRARARDGARVLALRARTPRLLRAHVHAARRRDAASRGGAARDGDALHPARRGGARDRDGRAAARPRPDRRHQRAVGEDPRRGRARRVRPARADGARPPRGGPGGDARERGPLARALRDAMPLLDWLAGAHRSRPGVDPGAAPRPASATDWPFPFPSPGRAKPSPPDAIPPGIAYRWPFHPLEGPPLPSRGVPAPVSLADFKRELSGWCDDAGVISIDDPALAHERAEILWVYPHTRSLVCMIGEENKAAMQSRYLPSANNELYRCEERLTEMGRRTVKYVNALPHLPPHRRAEVRLLRQVAPGDLRHEFAERVP